ncbi:hypothetical protein KFU94_20830 [Chloroflexi bacterium TSY]|nr:hypothetical protein [Chloroflexi bacterium TSY]MBV7330641.1 hypothetical protein [Chloroflexi bacterium TSY]
MFWTVKYPDERIQVKEIDYYLDQTDKVIAENHYTQVVRWYVCKSGYTSAARKTLEETGIFYSDLDEFNDLSKLFGIPSLEEE